MKRRHANLEINYRLWKNVDLKDELRAYGLKVSGNKLDLVLRLEEAVEQGRRKIQHPLAIITTPDAVLRDSFEDAHMNTIPVNVLLYNIVPYLNETDMYCLAASSKRWYRVLMDYLNKKAIDIYGMGATSMCFNMQAILDSIPRSLWIDTDFWYGEVHWALGLGKKSFPENSDVKDLIRACLKKHGSLFNYFVYVKRRKLQIADKELGYELISRYFTLYRRWRTSNPHFTPAFLLLNLKRNQMLYDYFKQSRGDVSIVHCLTDMRFDLRFKLQCISNDPFVQMCTATPDLRDCYSRILKPILESADEVDMSDITLATSNYKASIAGLWAKVEEFTPLFKLFNPLTSEQLQQKIHDIASGKESRMQIDAIMATAIGREHALLVFNTNHCQSLILESDTNQDTLDEYLYGSKGIRTRIERVFLDICAKM